MTPVKAEMMTREEQFEMFWKAYPRRIGKGAARKAFPAAIRKTDLATMLRAIEAYKANKPTWQDFCHPSTWLNGERWDDEWEPARPSTGHAMLDALMIGRAH